MSDLKPGDRISCRVRFNCIINPYDPDYDQVKTFEIVSKDDFGCFVYIPYYLYFNDSQIADSYLCKLLNIDNRFMNEKILYVQDKMIYKIVSILDGCFCAMCHEFYQFSEPNQNDGTLICWSCR